MTTGNLGIKAIEYYLPSYTLTLKELKEKSLISSDINKLRLFGYNQVHISQGENAYDMALKVGQQLLKQNQISPEEINILVCGHTIITNHLVNGESPDGSFADQFKFTGFRLQDELGLTKARVLGLSQLTCSSFIAALQIVDALMMADATLKTALIICADYFPPNASRELGFTLQSDGSCTALVCRDCQENRPVAFESIVKGNLWDWDSKLDEMVGVFNQNLLETINLTLQKVGIDLSDIGLIIPINTSSFAWKIFEQSTGYPHEYIFTKNVGHIGHAMSCDTLINLADALSANLVDSGEYILLIAQGWGAHWDCAILKH